MPGFSSLVPYALAASNDLLVLGLAALPGAAVSVIEWDIRKDTLVKP
jgi:hypothetical protein